MTHLINNMCEVFFGGDVVSGIDARSCKLKSLHGWSPPLPAECRSGRWEVEKLVKAMSS